MLFLSVVFKGGDGEWYLRLESAHNHEVIMSSEGHKNRTDVLDVAWKLGYTVVEVDHEGQRVLVGRDR